MTISIKEAVALTRVGLSFDIDTIDFDINDFYSEISYDYHEPDSGQFENEYEILKEKTLLHIAIESKNIPIFNALLGKNVNIDLDARETVKRKQRCRVYNADFSGPPTKWSDWEDWDPTYSTITTRELAQKIGNQEIVSKLQNRSLPISSSSSSVPSLSSSAALPNNSSSSSSAALPSSSSSSSSAALPSSSSSSSSAALPNSSSSSNSAALPNMNSDPLIDQLSSAFQQTAIDPYKGKIVKANGERNGRHISLYGFPDANTAKEFELKWQKKVTTKFFRIGKPLKNNKHSYELYNFLIKNLNDLIGINGSGRRSFIIALSKLVSEKGYMPELRFQLGITIINLTRVGSYTERQQGNFSMVIPALGQYHVKYGSGCFTRLARIIREGTFDPALSVSRINVLKGLISKKMIRLDAFELSELNPDGQIKLSSESGCTDSGNEDAKKNIHFLNGLLFLVTIVEVLVRLYRTKEGHIFQYADDRGINSDAFPVAIAQARSLLLLLHGEITFNDFIGKTQRQNYDAQQHRAYYGAVTGHETINHIDIMLEKLCAINIEYNALISNRPAWTQIKKDYLESNPNGHVIEGRSRMYFDLEEIYGSNNESGSDSSGYSSEEDSDLKETITYTP